MTLALLVCVAVLFVLHTEIKLKQRHSDSQELQGSDDDVS